MERELTDLIDAETQVDMDRLKDLSRHGIPDSIRGHVWKYLLEVTSPDKTQEVTRLKQLKLSFIHRLRTIVNLCDGDPYYKSLLMKIKSCLNHEKYYLMKRLIVNRRKKRLLYHRGFKSTSSSSSSNSSSNSSNNSSKSTIASSSSTLSLFSLNSTENTNHQIENVENFHHQQQQQQHHHHHNICREKEEQEMQELQYRYHQQQQQWEEYEAEKGKNLLIQMEHVLLTFLLQDTHFQSTNNSSNSHSHSHSHGSGSGNTVVVGVVEQSCLNERKRQVLLTLQQNFDVGIIDLLCPFVYALQSSIIDDDDDDDNGGGGGGDDGIGTTTKSNTTSSTSATTTAVATTSSTTSSSSSSSTLPRTRSTSNTSSSSSGGESGTINGSGSNSSSGASGSSRNTTSSSSSSSSGGSSSSSSHRGYHYGDEHDIFYCFDSFMNKIMNRVSIGLELNQSVGKLMTLFRCTQIDLYRYFEQEEVEPNDWANPWIRYMLSRELPMSVVCRLYDQYFATDDFDLHYYVCLAILQHFQEELMELDYSEIRLFLRFLPADKMDVERVIKHAQNIRAYVTTKNLI